MERVVLLESVEKFCEVESVTADEIKSEPMEKLAVLVSAEGFCEGTFATAGA